VDFSAFHTDADNIAAIRFNTDPNQFLPAIRFFQLGQFEQAAFALTQTRVDLDIVSEGETTTNGVDIVATWQPFNNLSTEIGYSYTKIAYDLPEGVNPTIGFDSTNRQIFSKVNYTFFSDHSIFATLRVENSDAYNTDRYTTMDITWNYQINQTWSTAVSGKNLFAGSHIEYDNTRETYTLPNYIDECFTLSIKARF
jgi:iron complex outermembrane receptor protein